MLGFARDDAALPFLDDVLSQHEAVRDATTERVHGELDIEYEPWPYIATLSFTYAFNAFKAGGLLLPQFYCEAAAAVLRQLWEVSLNVHWLERLTRSLDAESSATSRSWSIAAKWWRRGRQRS